MSAAVSCLGWGFATAPTLFLELHGQTHADSCPQVHTSLPPCAGVLDAVLGPHSSSFSLALLPFGGLTVPSPSAPLLYSALSSTLRMRPPDKHSSSLWVASSCFPGGHGGVRRCRGGAEGSKVRRVLPPSAGPGDVPLSMNLSLQATGGHNLVRTQSSGVSPCVPPCVLCLAGSIPQSVWSVLPP